MILSIFAIVVGLVLLVWSSDRFVDGASALAYNLGVSPLVIGLTVVGFGTSAPEMLVATFAALDNNPALGVGNAVGSNIANIALVMGFTALLMPLTVHSRIIKLELPILMGATLLAGLMMMSGELTRLNGLLLIVTLFAILARLVRDAMTTKSDDVIVGEMEAEMETELSLKQAIMWFVIGLIVLLISAKILVWGAVNIAHAFGVSDLVIGLTIVAIGTSLPELAASLSAAKKNESDLVLGNVIGSNLFNILGVLAIPGLLGPSEFPKEAVTRDFPVMLGLTVLLLLFAFGLGSRDRKINRWQGGFLLALFIGYQFVLFSSMG